MSKSVRLIPLVLRIEIFDAPRRQYCSYPVMLAAAPKPKFLKGVRLLLSTAACHGGHSASIHERSTSKSASLGSTAAAPDAFACLSTASSQALVNTRTGIQRVDVSLRNRTNKSVR